MKRVKKLVLAALMVAMMAIAMVGCGSQNYDGRNKNRRTKS